MYVFEPLWSLWRLLEKAGARPLRRRPRCSKFGKYIQRRQLEIPEYAASFVDYKALKKLIKQLSASPVIQAQDGAVAQGSELLDRPAALQANKATFFFRLDRELEKVNKFYLQKEGELKLRLETLLEKKKSMQAQSTSASKLSFNFIALNEGLQQFNSDLDKLQQFVEINGQAFSKILKKWDKTSKSEEKEIFLARAVDVQPCFNRDVISNLSDQATTHRLDLADWAEGEQGQYTPRDPGASGGFFEETEIDPQVLEAISAGNVSAVQEWIGRVTSLPNAEERLTRAFLSTADEAPEQTLQPIFETKLVRLDEVDEINQRNILHKAAISGRKVLLELGLSQNVDVRATDVYGRIPLHYACMHGHVDIIDTLIRAGPDTIDAQDLDKFTPLIHGIAHSELECVKVMLSCNASCNPATGSDHIPLNLACQHGSAEIVELLLKGKPQILPDAEGLYPQHQVARSGKNPQLVNLLKDYGADLNQPDKVYRWTPLFYAASEGKVECLRALLNCGADPDIEDEKHLPAMYYAIWEGHHECMSYLAQVGRGFGLSLPQQVSPQMPPSRRPAAAAPPSLTPAPMPSNIEAIPEIVLPPPIIPRRYGHNFLEGKTYVVLSFGEPASSAIQFYDNTKYPAARLTISSKSSDLVPRNILLPIQDEFKVISFQIDNLDTFSIDFDIFPTFGSKVIARTAASSKVFTDRASSSGHWHLELFDPRLRAIGRISFAFQVVKPFRGTPLEITHFATYWKATGSGSQSNGGHHDEAHPSTLVTGSSLSGDYVRLSVQITADGVPILYPRWKLSHHGLVVPINSLTLDQFASIGRQRRAASEAPMLGAALPRLLAGPAVDLPALFELLESSFVTLSEALAALPPSVHVELHVLYPSMAEEEGLRLGHTANINDAADALLDVVFEHARALRERNNEGTSEVGGGMSLAEAGAPGSIRSVVFSSFNPQICTALNWKQPNYPVLLCNELGAEPGVRAEKSGQMSISVKEAVQIAQNNNFMGVICSSRLLQLAPALIRSIKVAGLVLISDVSGEPPATQASASSAASAQTGVDGVLKGNGVLRFNDSVDM
ncbi:putative ankyrin repeat protein nuc-2 [Lineolata rhizophorae]|uniref:Putative ankyrin repeat protein nuc-2 n=1 Tax=Lineolata rhizophorae TaxID=578093 RepID=A0A6A6PCF6_9PEZI|nr:putative ankyrin repeat protein nuc-2 [Lineolata rhizophorae]